MDNGNTKSHGMRGIRMIAQLGESGSTKKEASHSTLNTSSSGHYNHQIMSLLTGANHPFPAAITSSHRHISGNYHSVYIDACCDGSR